METKLVLVSMINTIRKYQEDPEHLPIVMISYDCKSALDKLDSTEVAIKCIIIGNRSIITKIMIGLMNERKMQVKMNGYSSTSYNIIWGFSQGSIFGQLLYIVGSDNVSDDFPEDDS